MVPFERFAFEGDRTETNKDNQRNHLLDHLQLDQVKRPAIVTKPHPVCRDLKAILEKCQQPAEQDDTDQWQMLKPAELLLHLQMPIPGTRHKDIGYD